MLREIQACPAVRRQAEFQVPSNSAPGVEYTVKITMVQGQVECSCPGFRFRGTCHHTELTEERCGWQEGAPGAERQTPEQAHNGLCPRCGGGTIRLAVAAPEDPDDSEAVLRARGIHVPAPPLSGR